MTKDSLSSEVDDENKKYGWCYLENIVDPANPRNRCYEDAQWSEADGRFWSNVACLEEKKESEDEWLLKGTQNIAFRPRKMWDMLAGFPSESPKISTLLETATCTL